MYMEVEWDSKKAVSNLKKHRVDFADAVAALCCHSQRAVNDELYIDLGSVFFP